MIRLAFPLLLSTALLLGGCSGLNGPSPYVGWYKGYDTCRDEYLEMDARVAAAGVGDAAYFRVPGYPYLRTDRMTASFAHEVEGIDQTGGWIRRMREFDQEAREFEYRNLGMSQQEIGIQRHRFLNCSRALVTFELAEPDALEKLKSSVTPDDGYSDLARTLGLYPLMVRRLQSRIAAEHESVRREFSRPLAELDATTPLQLWTVEAAEDPLLAEVDFRAAIPDEFGLPGLTESQWQALAERYAPALWIESGGEFDQPGAPRWGPDAVDVDSTRAQVNYSISFARFGAEPVMQITYFVWFRGVGPASPHIDGLIWRTTLDMDARPLTHESLHAAGHSHYWFPVQPLTPRPADSIWRQAGLLPQGRVEADRAALRLQSGSHALRRVVPVEQAQAEQRRHYVLSRYEDLYSLPLPGGGRRSLFGPDGLVPGPAGSDPTWSWSSGVRHPGALKQYGHHTPAYVGRGHFDAPFLLDSVFLPRSG